MHTQLHADYGRPTTPRSAPLWRVVPCGRRLPQPHVRAAAGSVPTAESGRRRVLVERRSRAGRMPVRCEGTLSQSGPTLKLDRQRVRRWQQRRTTSRLDDQPPGGNPIHCILEWEVAAVIELFEEWGEVDLSHRKLAHRCWYLERGWVSPSTVDRILARHGSLSRGSRTVALGEEALATEGAMVTEQAVVLGRQPVRTVPSSEVRACDRRHRFTPSGSPPCSHRSIID